MTTKINDISSLTRTAAIIYAEESIGNRKTETIRRKFIESIFVLRDNINMSIMSIIDSLEEDLSITFSEQEVSSLIKGHESFEYIVGKTPEKDTYRLVGKRYILLKDRSTNVIQNTYEKFINERDLSNDDFVGLMQRYLYYLLNTNIDAFSSILKGSTIEATSDILEQFSDEEVQIINDFLNWKDNDKNIALYKLISCCIEYAVAVNNSKESILSGAIKNKAFYLDNALLYRALGINGIQRKKRTLSFLKKCIETGQTLHVTCISRHEFMETIDYHINQIKNTTPFGNINPTIFRKIMSGSFCQYYHEWRSGKVRYGFDLFKSNIISEYNKLVEQFHINEEFKYPFPENEEVKTIEDYKSGIKTYKTWNGSAKSDALHLYDAQNIYWIEQLRGSNNKTVEHTKFYFITSDLKLHSWDKQHSTTAQPVTLQPSQWMALLLKYTSRSTDDFNSFVSFLNIPREKNLISETELQVALAGISEITEDLKQQDAIVSNLFASNLSDLQNGGDIRQFAKAFAKDEMEKVYLERINEKEAENKQLNKKYQEDIEIAKQEFIEKLALQDQENQRKQQELLDKYETELRNREILTIKDKISQIQDKINDTQVLTEIADSRVNALTIIARILSCLLILAVLFGWGYYVYKHDWNFLEPITYIVGVGIFAIEVICFMALGQSFNPIAFLEKFKNYRHKVEYRKHGIHDGQIEKLKAKEKALKDQLSELEKIQ